MVSPRTVKSPVKVKSANVGFASVVKSWFTVELASIVIVLSPVAVF